MHNHHTCLYRLQVDLYENGTIAIVECVSPELGNRVQRVRVQLPGTSSELLQKFREKKVNFAAHSNTEDGGAVFLNLLGEWRHWSPGSGSVASSLAVSSTICNASCSTFHVPLLLEASCFMQRGRCKLAVPCWGYGDVAALTNHCI